MIAQVFPSDWIRVAGPLDAAIFALILGVLNAAVRPVLVLVTCPITVLTLGLFILVVNAIVFGLAAWLTPGVAVNGFLPALVGSLIVSVVSAAVNQYLE